ncbi:MAG: hypothetical protein E6K18_07680 [Methanobacteriota archaeon]|nr:MAG: hypothetical protein E6K18_07680 [Euryarchaeota archaeon]
MCTCSPPWIRLGIDGGVPAIARDPALSGDFAFGISGPGEFAITAKARAHDGALVASDLESLLANPTQAERFEGIVASARSLGLAVSQPTPPEDATRASVVEFSSWSDYDEHLHEGHTSDTRWTGLRRSDGLVVSRTHGGEPVSQLWKHALTLATEQVETAVRRTARDLLHPFELDRRREIVRQLGVAYGRHLWREHYRANGSPASSLDFGRQAEAIVGGKVDVEVVAYLSRAYVTMLMGLRSDPRFWDNLDTRVTFQNVANLAASLLDAAEACRRAHRQEDAGKLVRLLEATLLEFDQAYGRHRFSNLNGVEGWVTTEAAWLRSLQSEVPRQSSDNAVARAARFQAASPDAPKDAHSNFVADTGHIAGEAHGEWDNRDWCEHRGR